MAVLFQIMMEIHASILLPPGTILFSLKENGHAVKEDGIKRGRG